MTIQVRVDSVHRLRYAAASGILTDADVLEVYAGVLSDPGYDPALDMVFDCTAVERLDVKPETIAHIAALVARADRDIPEDAHPRAAIVAPADALFGMARMYQAHRELQHAPRRYFVCRTMDEAVRWLGLAEESGW